MFFQMVGVLVVVYLVVAAANAGGLFLAATLSFIRSNSDVEVPGQTGKIIWAALLWPRALWLMHRHQSLAEWKRAQEFKRRRFRRRKETEANVGRRVEAVREIQTFMGDYSNYDIPAGMRGRIVGSLGSKDKGFGLDIQWDDPRYKGHPYEMDTRVLGWGKFFFERGDLVLLPEDST